MVMSTRRILLGLTAVGALTAIAGCMGPPRHSNETLVTVQATETTRTSPDLAIISLGVVTRGATAREANEAQATRMSQVMAAVKAAGLEEKDVQTANISLTPQYTYPRNGPPRISGYEGRNMVTIRVRKLDAIGGLLDAVVADGANELSGINYTFENPETARNEARKKAVETALARAEAYASAANLKVRKVVSITEEGAPQPQPGLPYATVARTSDAAAEQSATPTSAGEIESSASVIVVVALK
jgi:uncharacterized protein